MEDAHSPCSSASCVRSADADPVATRLRDIPGIGLLTATAFVGTVGHIHAFRRARQFASWLGLTPREYSSGARRRLGGISKRGDVYLRCLLTHGARAVLHAAHRRTDAQEPLTRLHQWALTVQARRGHNKATIAVANKLGRIVWAVWTRDVEFDPRPALPEAAYDAPDRPSCAGRLRGPLLDVGGLLGGGWLATTQRVIDRTANRR